MNIVDLIIGERHPFYLKLYYDQGLKKEFIGAWSHLSKTPDVPVKIFDDGNKAFNYTMRMNRMHRLAKKAVP